MRVLLMLLLLSWVPSLSAQSNLGPNLSITGPGAGSDGSSKASGTSYSSVRDGNISTFWSPASSSNEHVTIKWSTSVSSNTIILKEVGNRVTSWRLETREGVVLATGTTIGSQRQVNYSAVSTDKIFLYILTASALPQIGEFEVYSATGAASSTIQIQENATGFCLVDGTVDNNHTGFTGSGFANTDNASGKGVNWRVNAPSAGSYTLRWRYANGGTADRPGRVLVGGTQQVASVSFGTTGGWATWATSGNATVTLAAGANDIRLEATAGAGLGNIDWIEVTGNSPTAVACGSSSSPSTIQIQENATGFCLVDGTVDNNHTGFTGSGFANTDNASGKGINWQVNTPSAGSYTLRWRYANGGTADRPGRVLVGGTQQVASVSFGTTGGWATWATSGNATVTLASGTNTIRLEATASQGLANIDWIEVTGISPAPASCSGGGGNPTYTLTVSASPSNGGSVSLSPSGGTYPAGTVVTLTASPASGFTFSNWSGAASGSSATTTVTMNSNLSATANFQQAGGSGGSGANFALVGYATLAGGTTGGAGGDWVIVSTGSALQQAINNKGSQPRTIYVNGPITPGNSPGLSKIDIKDVRDISILGLGSGAEFNGIGIKLWRTGNIILRNLRVHSVSIGDKDCISIEGPTDHVWVDHCELYNQYQGVGKDFYDGLLDLKGNTDYVTFSWNYFHDSWKCSISGSSESDVFDRRVTYHHNIYENINSRVPLFRSGQGHIYNNYYKDIASTTINSRINACVRIENNYFENANNPWVSAYSNVLGAVQTLGNTLVSSPFNYSASDINEPLSCTLNVPYSYTNTLNSTSAVPSLLAQNAGVGVLNITAPSAKTTNLDAATGPSWQRSIQVAPNPSQGRFQVSFDLAAHDQVHLQIFNRLGQQIGPVADHRLSSGHHTLPLDLSHLPPGMYSLVLTSREGTAHRQVIIH